MAASPLAFSAGLLKGKNDRLDLQTKELVLHNEELRQATAQAALDLQNRTLQHFSQMDTKYGSSMQNPGEATGGDSTSMFGTSAIVNKLVDGGDFALSQGNLSEAGTAYAKSLEILEKGQEIQDKAHVAQATQINQIADAFSFQKVYNQETFDKANQAYEALSGRKSQFSGKTFTPELLATIQHGIYTVQQRQAMEAERARINASKAAANASNKIAALRELQAQSEQQKIDDHTKNGSFIEPKAGEVRIFTDLMATNLGVGMSEETRRVARPLARDMVTLAKKEGIPLDIAAERVYDEAEKAGKFGGFKQRQVRLGSKDNPRPLVYKRDGTPDLTKVLPHTWTMIEGVPRYRIGDDLYTQAELKARGIVVPVERDISLDQDQAELDRQAEQEEDEEASAY